MLIQSFKNSDEVDPQLAHHIEGWNYMCQRAVEARKQGRSFKKSLNKKTIELLRKVIVTIRI